MPKITRSHHLSDLDWEYIKKYHPDIALPMIRHKTEIRGATSRHIEFMNTNFEGFFYRLNNDFYFERIDDLVLFRSKF